MSFVKTPTSSLTAIELLVNKIWYRTKAKVKWCLSGGFLKTPTPHQSSAARIPQELVEAIISYFIYDTRTLLACSMTCYSWYIAAVPHLHHSLTTDDWMEDSKHRWPNPLRESYNLGLLPLVKRFRIRLSKYPERFGPDRLGRCTLRYLSAFTSLQELGIDCLQISSIIPDIQRYFGHLSPTLRLLALKKPKGSCRQILYFIGLFPNLQDLKLHYDIPEEEQENAEDAGLVPLSVPPLRGTLTLTCFTREKLVKDMIGLFGGLRFRRMELFRVKCTRLLLGACAKTLERLRLYPSDPYMGSLGSLRRFNLSRNKALRTLETTAESIVVARGAASGSLRAVLSTVTSPTFFNLVVIYDEYDIDIWRTYISDARCQPGHLHNVTCSLQGSSQRYQKIFKMFREMHRVRGFQLVLYVDASDATLEYALRTLRRFVNIEMMEGRLEYLPRRPLIIAKTLEPYARRSDHSPGALPMDKVPASAL